MPDDNTQLIAALKGAPLQEVDNPEAKSGPLGALAGVMGHIATIPQRAIENSQHSLNTGNYDPSAPMEAATTLMGVGAPAAEAGAAGIFGGQLAKGANLTKLEQAQRMIGKKQDRDITRQITGWFQGPEGGWRFEIPDERSRMLYLNASGPAEDMFSHPELYRNYPQLRNIKTFSEVNPNFPSNTGQWNLPERMMELSSKSSDDARAGALHELQHAIQHMEGFGTGGNVRTFEEMFKQWPQEMAKLAPGEKPFDLYNRVSGEVESRNAETRRNFDPQQRSEVAPWHTHDMSYERQIVMPPLDVTHPWIKALREGRAPEKNVNY